MRPAFAAAALRSYVEDPIGCWNWKGHTDKDGYGKVSNIPAHRFFYRHLVGEIPDGLTLDHLCRNRLCVNPDHLEPVTRGENTRRGFLHPRRPRTKPSECKKGHPLSGDNLYLRPNGKQICKECRKVEKRAYRERQRANQEANS